MRAGYRYRYERTRVRWVPLWALVAVTVLLALVLTAANLRQASRLVESTQQRHATVTKVAAHLETRPGADRKVPNALPLVFAGIVFLLAADSARPYRFGRSF
jgi:hypothetical protein